MSEHPRNLDRETAERLLDGASPTREPAPLARLLATAAGPARPHELSGEDSAVLAFRAAKSAPRRRPWRRWLTFKAIAAALGVLTAGGLAFASGIIPGPFGPDPLPSVSSDPPLSPSEHGHASPGPGEATATRGPQLPAEAMRGLCRAYQAKPASERSKELEKAAFQDLVWAAGGADRVESYCATMLADEKPERSHPAKPSPATPAPQPQPVTPTQARR